MLRQRARALSSDELVVLAEQALDEAKRRGRDRAMSATRARAMWAAQPSLAV